MLVSPMKENHAAPRTALGDRRPMAIEKLHPIGHGAALLPGDSPQCWVSLAHAFFSPRAHALRYTLLPRPRSTVKPSPAVSCSPSSKHPCAMLEPLSGSS